MHSRGPNPVRRSLSAAAIVAGLLAMLGAVRAQGVTHHDLSVSGVARNSQDDIGFLRALIGSVQSEYGTDPRRVYVAGMSNGAMMSLRVACQMPEVAAVAAVSGGLPVRWKDNCKPAHPVSVLGIDGTADPIVPYNGGGHGWPGSDRHFPKRLVGTVSQSFDANAYVWDFLKTHSL